VLQYIFVKKQPTYMTSAIKC